MTDNERWLVNTLRQLDELNTEMNQARKRGKNTGIPGMRGGDWLEASGWEEVDVESPYRWKSPENGTVLCFERAFHQERNRIRRDMELLLEQFRVKYPLNGSSAKVQK